MPNSVSAANLPTDQDDILSSTRDGEVIHGLAGNDDITGHHLRLTLFGDGGNDTIQAAGGVTGTIYGGDGNDLIYGTAGVRTLFDGGKGADRIELAGSGGLPLNATLSFTGSVQAVRVFLNANGSGYGTAGDAKGDVYLGLFTRVVGSAGNDWITDETPFGALDGTQSQKFDGGAGDDRLNLGSGDDTGLGGAGHDLINGGYGNDRLLGGDDDDAIAGGIGHDQLKGGLGADHFVFGWGEATFAGLPVSDHILDFNRAEGDKIDLSAIDASAGLNGEQAFTFLGSNPFSDSQGQLRYDVSAKGVTFIAWDGYARSNAQTGLFEKIFLTVFVAGVTSLTAEDFIL